MFCFSRASFYGEKCLIPFPASGLANLNGIQNGLSLLFFFCRSSVNSQADYNITLATFTEISLILHDSWHFTFSCVGVYPCVLDGRVYVS